VAPNNLSPCNVELEKKHVPFCATGFCFFRAMCNIYPFPAISGYREGGQPFLLLMAAFFFFVGDENTPFAQH